LSDEYETTGWFILPTPNSDLLYVTSSPFNTDTDSDRLPDDVEWQLGTNPQSIDTDGDGMGDYEEILLGMNPRDPDMDNDGLDDGEEQALGTNASLIDTDGDQTPDHLEYTLGSNPTSNDTDQDGATDTLEFVIGSDPNSPDSDGDFMFDGIEIEMGLNPQDNDTDHDHLPDGLELLIGTSPFTNDTDHDNVTDAMEIILMMNPLSNDTDGDGVVDSTELTFGSNPLSNFSIPLDPSVQTFDEQIIIVADQDKDISKFNQILAGYVDVTVVSLDDFLENYTDSPNVVLIGTSYFASGSVGELIHSIMQDCGNETSSKSIYDHIVRYGIWNETQATFIMADVSPADIFFILNIMRAKNVTIKPNYAFLEFAAVDDRSIDENSTISYIIEEIDTIKQTNSIFYLILNQSADLSIEITQYDNDTTPYPLDRQHGLIQYELSLNRYIEPVLTIDTENEDIVDSILIKLFYRLEDLDRTGDGQTLDHEDLNETTLVPYYYDLDTNRWVKLDKSMDWVLNMDINLHDIRLHGENYAGYIWMHITKLSPFSAAGYPNNSPPDVSQTYPSKMYLWPPNGRFKEITIEGVTDPDGDPVNITILGITSDEPFFICFPSEVYGIGTDTARVQARRFGHGNGRVYAITFLAIDGRGGENIGVVNVYVPHDRRQLWKKELPIDDGQIYNVTDQEECWNIWKRFHFRSCKHKLYKKFFILNHQSKHRPAKYYKPRC
jgi:hypothetical protein